MRDNLALIGMWLAFLVNIGLAVGQYQQHQRLARLNQAFSDAHRHAKLWQKTADALLQENGYEAITTLVEQQE